MLLGGGHQVRRGSLPEPDLTDANNDTSKDKYGGRSVAKAGAQENEEGNIEKLPCRFGEVFNHSLERGVENHDIEPETNQAALKNGACDLTMGVGNRTTKVAYIVI